MKVVTKLSIILISLLLNGCATVYFENGEISNKSSAQKTVWHHNFIYALYEGSSPVKLQDNCGSDSWRSVKTQFTMLNLLSIVGAEGVFVSLTHTFIHPFFGAEIGGASWTPMTVEILCDSK